MKCPPSSILRVFQIVFVSIVFPTLLFKVVSFGNDGIRDCFKKVKSGSSNAQGSRMTPSLASLEEEVRTLKEQLDEARGKAEGIQGLREEVQRRSDRNARWHGYFGPGSPQALKIA